jgi:hypothetical protein
MKTKQKNSPYEGFGLVWFGLVFFFFFQFCDTKNFANFSPKKKKPKLFKLALENNIFQKKFPIFGLKKRQDLSRKTTGACLHPMVEK